MAKEREFSLHAPNKLKRQNCHSLTCCRTGSQLVSAEARLAQEKSGVLMNERSFDHKGTHLTKQMSRHGGDAGQSSLGMAAQLRLSRDVWDPHLAAQGSPRLGFSSP